MKIDKVLTINNTLQPDVWSNNELDELVSEKLMQIATKFFEDLDLKGIDIDDVTFTGSLANYNWTKYSDVDLHILVDYKKVDDNVE